MKRVIVGGVALVLAAAAGLTIWLVTPSDVPTTYPTEQSAVIAVCHADPAHVHIQAGGAYTGHPQTTFSVAWSKKDVFQASFAELKLSHNRFVVQTCGSPTN